MWKKLKWSWPCHAINCIHKLIASIGIISTVLSTWSCLSHVSLLDTSSIPAGTIFALISQTVTHHCTRRLLALWKFPFAKTSGVGSHVFRDGTSTWIRSLFPCFSTCKKYSLYSLHWTYLTFTVLLRTARHSKFEFVFVIIIDHFTDLIKNNSD